MHKYLIVIERAEGNFSTYSPDLPGCVATGSSPEEAKSNMHEAIQMHLEGLKQDGLPIPEPESTADYVSVSVSSADSLNPDSSLLLE